MKFRPARTPLAPGTFRPEMLVLAAGLLVVASLILTGLLAGWIPAATAPETASGLSLLPATVAQTAPLPLQRAPVLRISANGAVQFNGYALDPEPEALTLLLKRYRASAQAARVPPSLIVRTDPETPFELLAPVLAACNAARIGTVRLMY